MMHFTIVGLVLFGLLFFWGAGLAMLVLPGPWRRYWPVFAALTGIGAVSAVVWLGAYARLPGTVAYGAWTWAVPVALLAVALGRRARAAGGLGRALAEAVGDLRRLGGVIGLTLGVLVATTHWMSQAERKLNSFSAGSCDAADYAAGARVFREFAIDDCSGQLGNREVVALHGSDHFATHWLRQNHFTPVALLAWWSGVLGYKIHELVTLTGAVLLATGVPMAFWAGRALFGLGAGSALALAAAFGLGGVQLYAVAQVALGQQIAAGAIVGLVWAGVRAGREAAMPRRAWRWLPPLVLAMWLFLGAYNFMLPLAAAPLGAWFAWELRRPQGWRRIGRTVGVLAAAGVLAALFAPARVLGLVDRYALLNEHDFGWFIPGFTPERWFGWFGDAGLNAAAGPGRWWIAALFLGLPAVWAVGAWRREPTRLALAFACAVPAMIGYGWLVAVGYQRGTHATYNAYKLFAVFHPLLLAGWGVWLRWGRSDGWGSRAAALGAIALVAVHWAGAAPLRNAIARPVLRLSPETVDLRRIERMDDVTSLNLVLEPFWDRLWANGFLLRKPQFFRTYTYETRRPTALRGDWDLRDRAITVEEAGVETRMLNGRFYLARHRPQALDVTWGEGWFPLEQHGTTHWCWSGATAVLVGKNPQANPRVVRLSGGMRSVVPREVEVWLRGRRIWSGRIGESVTPVTIAGVEFLPGLNAIELRLPAPPVRPPGDSRALGVALSNLTVSVAGGAETGRP